MLVNAPPSRVARGISHKVSAMVAGAAPPQTVVEAWAASVST
jgi:hypothetical protein